MSLGPHSGHSWNSWQNSLCCGQEKRMIRTPEIPNRKYPIRKVQTTLN